MKTTIKEIPLLFQTEMVQSILADRKTQTRRTRGLESKNEHPDVWNRDGNPMKEKCRFWDSSKEDNPNPIAIEFGFKHKEGGLTYQKSIFGKPGDLLWVRETHSIFKQTGGTIQREKTKYKADRQWDNNSLIKWKPSIHMPKAACRLWLMVEEIRVERVQDISEADAVAEGIESQFIHLFQELRYRCYSSKNKTPYQGFPQHWASNWREPISSFQSLWISINGQASWDANLWVWVVKFRVLSKTGRPSDQVIEQNWKEVTGG